MRDPRGYLWDVKDAATAILGFVADLESAAYAGSELVHSAVERKFEIVGEALSALAKTDSKIANRIPDFRQMIAFRNVLIHGYATVDHERVWEVIKDDLPKLLQIVTVLLDELDRK